MAADLFEEHRVLIAAAEALQVLVRRMPPAPIEEIAQLRVRVANLALSHLRHEDDVIIKPLLASGRVDEIPGAANLIADIRIGHTTYSNHVRSWTLQAVELDRAGYAEALIGMIDYLRKMTAREENLLYWPALRLLNSKSPEQTG
jgi:hypothetical protein